MVLTLPLRIQDALHRVDMHVTRWSMTPTFRRAQILNGLRVNALIDVGANIGQYALLARRAGYRGPIVSYEPISELFNGLAAAAARDEAWTCRQIAVGAEAGEAEINVSADSLFSSFRSATAETTRVHPRAAVTGTETVTVETLDKAVAADAPGGRLAVKVDVQGFEREVLAGGSAALARSAYLELELSLVPTYDGAPTIDEMLTVVYELGFRLVLVENLLPDRHTGHALQLNGVFVRA